MNENHMPKIVDENNIGEYIRAVSTILEDQRATDIELLHVAKLTTMADYFIICSGNSVTHIRALSEAVEHELETKFGLRPHHIEGYSAANWILMDYGFLVVHIFHRETRQFYSLSRLWNDPGQENQAEGKQGEEI